MLAISRLLLAACTGFLAAAEGLRRCPAPALLAGLLLVLGVSPAQAQSVASCEVDTRKPMVQFSGTVADASGAAINDAIITLTCGDYKQETHSRESGAYSISAPAGNYQVRAEAIDFDMVVQNIKLEPNQHQTLNFSLPVKPATSIVSVTAPLGYVATSATTATKTDTPLIETPQSVSVITQDQLTSRDVQSLGEALRYSAGVGVDTFGTETRFEWFNIRGFDESTFGLFRDNSRWQSGQVEGAVDPYELQEVDVIKGPSSVLYGQNTPGGLVNLVTKRPTEETFGEVGTQFGGFGRAQVQFDVGGPLDHDAHWRYRLTGLFRDSGTQVNFVPDNRDLIAPALTWAPSRSTTLTILTDYQHDNTGWSMFLPSQGTLTPNPNGMIPVDFFVGEPAFDFFHRQQWSAAYLFEHRFPSVWTFRQTSRYSRIDYNGDDAFGGGFTPPTPPNYTILSRYGFSNALSLGLYTIDTQALAQFKTGPLGHSILFGVDYSHADAITISGISFPSGGINVFDPVYGQVIPPPSVYLHTDQPSWQTGLYFQDNIKVARKLVTTLSAREDWTNLTTTNLPPTTPSVQTQAPNHFTGRAGITYLSDIGLAPYFSYSTSFLPTPGTTFGGVEFKPTTGEQYEAGVKYQPKGIESFITVSFFNITEHNVLSPDPNHLFFNVQEGAIRSRGMEAEAVASILHGLNLHASYSYIDEVVTENSDPKQIGKRPILFPDQLFSLLLDYTNTKGSLRGLGGNFGVRYVGTTAGDVYNDLILPDYHLFDAAVRYDRKQYRFQVNVTNLADKIYVPVCESVNYCNYGYRRTVTGSVFYRWSEWK